MKLWLCAATEVELSEFADRHLHIEDDAGGEGYGPLQMFAASLALCTASALISYNDNVLGVGVDLLTLRVRWDYAERPKRVGAVQMEIDWPGLPDNRVRAAERAAKSCTVHHTLEQPPRMLTRVTNGKGAP